MSSKIDTDISNYTLAELMVIVDLDDLDPDDIIRKTVFYIEKYRSTDPNLSTFFQSIQDELLRYIEYEEPKETNKPKIGMKMNIKHNQKIQYKTIKSRNENKRLMSMIINMFQ